MRLTLALTVLIVLVPGSASAQCITVPFNKVVRSSDAVLVGTIADATFRGHTQVIARLDVEQVLSGSPDDSRVAVGGCGPPFTHAEAIAAANSQVGTRNLFLLTKGPGHLFYTSNVITTPQNMSLAEKIAQARQVLGLDAPVVRVQEGRSAVWAWVLVITVIVAGLGTLVFVSRRANRSAQ